MPDLPTLSEALVQLKKVGYLDEFNLHKSCLKGQRSAILLSSVEFAVDQHFRFES